MNVDATFFSLILLTLIVSGAMVAARGYFRPDLKDLGIVIMAALAIAGYVLRPDKPHHYVEIWCMGALQVAYILRVHFRVLPGRLLLFAPLGSLGTIMADKAYPPGYVVLIITIALVANVINRSARQAKGGVDRKK